MRSSVAAYGLSCRQRWESQARAIAPVTGPFKVPFVDDNRTQRGLFLAEEKSERIRPGVKDMGGGSGTPGEHFFADLGKQSIRKKLRVMPTYHTSPGRTASKANMKDVANIREGLHVGPHILGDVVREGNGMARSLPGATCSISKDSTGQFGSNGRSVGE